MELLDKAAIMAELEKLYDIEYYNTSDLSCGKKIMLRHILLFLNTLEVKEESVSMDLEEAIEQSFIYHEKHGDDFRSDKQIETAYRYGFKTGVKYKELTSPIIEDIEKQNLEMKEEADLEKEIKNYFDKQPIITRSKCVDYQLIPSGEEIAKHFFKLGLKAQKGE